VTRKLVTETANCRQNLQSVKHEITIMDKIARVSIEQSTHTKWHKIKSQID